MEKKSLKPTCNPILLSIEKKGMFLAIQSVLQKLSRTYQTLLDKVNEDNEDIYRPLWYVGVFIIGKVFKYMCVLGFGKGDLKVVAVVMKWWQEELLL